MMYSIWPSLLTTVLQWLLRILVNYKNAENMGHSKTVCLEYEANKQSATYNGGGIATIRF